MRRYLILLAALVASLTIAACGGGDDEGSGGAETLDQSAAKDATGEVTWCIGKDTSGAFQKGIDAFNEANPKLKARLIQLPEAADAQREQQIQRLRAESPECDVLGMDVIWTAEYAAAGWLDDLTDVVEPKRGEFIPSTVEAVEYDGKLWAFPFNTNAGFLYYRTDQVDAAPKSWEDVYAAAKDGKGVVFQGSAYEGLTVNFLELLYSAGGKVLSEDGESSEIDSPEAREVLDFMSEGVKSGAVPKAVSTYKEEESRRAFEAGQATFMRNWPYAYALGKDSAIADKFDIATFPSYGGSEGAGVLGGYNLAVSAFSENPGGALKLAEFLVGPEAQKIMMTEASLPATLSSVYDDPDVRKATPFAEELRDAVAQAEPRPASPVYPQISEAIYKNVYEVINGNASADTAVSKMNEQIQKALETF